MDFQVLPLGVDMAYNLLRSIFQCALMQIHTTFEQVVSILPSNNKNWKTYIALPASILMRPASSYTTIPNPD